MRAILYQRVDTIIFQLKRTLIKHTMITGSKIRSISTFFGALGIVLTLAFLPITAEAQTYYDEDYYYIEDDMGYYAYESEIYEPFAPGASTTQPSSRSGLTGRKNIWEDEYDEETHPGDPLPLGDHTILFVLAAITAMVIFFQQRKRKQPSSSTKVITILAILFSATPIFALTNGDLRLQYIEQELKKEGKKTVVNRLYHFESHAFALADGATDTISVHIFNMIKGSKDHVNHPEIVLQEYDGSKWVDKEAHMIFGPLKDNAGMGLLPGRKNAGETSDSPIDDWVIQDGIENIKNDQTYADKGYRASGVWNFVVTKQSGVAAFDMTQVHRHEGNFYVRVNGDPNYLNDTNLVTFSEYAYKHIYEAPIGKLKPHDYTHYDCKFLPVKSNIKFTIATEHSPRIADELMVNSQRYKSDPTITDIYVLNQSGGQPILPAAANIRFSWDIMTNRLTRAYIGDTKVPSGEYLVAHENGQTPEARHHFQDNTNWMYSVDLDPKKGTPITVRAKFNGKNQLFWGVNESTGSPLIADDGSGDVTIYPIRVIYDFKDHRIVTIYKPKEATSGEVNLNTPVMIHRVHNNPATQFLFPSNEEIHKAVGTGDDTEDKYTNPAYAVLTFLEDKFATNVTSTSHYEKMFYWVSFPFDVKLSDVFGLGAYGEYWAVQYYDGEKRALYGLPTEESTGWEYVAETKEEADTKTLKANHGYVVCLNYKRLSKDYGYEADGGRKVSLYFPSANRVSPAEIKHQADVTVDLEEYTKGDKITWNHWNWHLLGVPSYANPGFSTTQGDVPFFYQYWHPTDGYAAVASTEVDFYAMHAYMVQYAGEIVWSKIVNTAPSGLAAKKNSSAIDKTMLRLELQQAGKTMDKTYVQLREEESTLGFDLNLDLTKIINKGANIYTVVNGDQMAGNVVPAEEAIIPLGVVIPAAGEYSFALPSNTNGMTVELIDYECGTSTNLIALDYTVHLAVGTCEGRFALRMQPNKVSTGVENGTVLSEAADVRKLIVGGALYLIKDGTIYDAQGHAIREL